jgi:LysM repeat protein
MVQISKADRDGRIVHEVQAYQTLTTIAQAYDTSVDTILNLNGIQVDWPLRIGQKLLIYPGNVTPSPTPRPLTPIEKLTPASDGKYYHTVRSGETLVWIADLYKVSVANLMAWNGLSGSAIYPDQKLVLQVTPPATQTETPGPPTATPDATRTPTPAPSTSTPTSSSQPPTDPAIASSSVTPAAGWSPTLWLVSIGLVAGGLILFGIVRRKK